MKVGITGKNGFVGYHLSNHVIQNKDLKLVDFERTFFQNNNLLDSFVSNCDIIVHLAAVNRHKEEDYIFDTNISLAKKLSDSIRRVKFDKKLVYVSSIHEKSETAYGLSKLKSKEIFLNLSKEENFDFTSLTVPNIFGPFCRPNYNSFISTFSYLLINNKEPELKDNKSIKLIYIDNLILEITKEFYNTDSKFMRAIEEDIEIKVDKVLEKLSHYQTLYIKNDVIPDISNSFDLNLFNTFRSYIDYKNFYPRTLKNNQDERGNFSEIIRTNSLGQFSFSTTNKGFIRGNHFHSRKVERFCVTSGKALICIRKIGTDEKLEFILDGETPSFIDMPIWYTHSIQNIGETPLTTLFWINEPYNPNDTDTFFENV